MTAVGTHLKKKQSNTKAVSDTAAADAWHALNVGLSKKPKKSSLK